MGNFLKIEWSLYLANNFFCRQETHSQDTSVQYSLITARTAHSMRLAWLKFKTKRDLQASLCPKIRFVIWCVTCLIHGCSLTPSSMSTSSSSPTSPTTQREHSVHPAHLQALSVDKLRHQESLWRENLQCGGNPRTTTPTGYEPKELATVSRIEDFSGDPYQFYDVQENYTEEDNRAPITEELEEFGEIRTAGVPDFKLSATTFVFNRRCISTNFEDGGLEKMRISPLYAQKAWVKPNAMVMQERGKCTIHSNRSKGKFEVSFF